MSSENMNALMSEFDYRVNLDVFEGPLDLLLYLIKKNDLDVYDIPVAFILEEYMRYVDTLKDLDIDFAGEFLFMAAELAHIKSRMLLPDGEIEQEEEDIDPRADLVKRLLEYQQFKEASLELAKRPMLGRDVFPSNAVESGDDTPEERKVEADVYELIGAFSKLLRKIPKTEVRNVEIDRISVSEKIYRVIDAIKENPTTTLEDLLNGDYSRYNVVITFLSLLEMTRLHMIKIYQASTNGPIHVKYVMGEINEDELADMISLDSFSNKTSSEEGK